VTAVGHVGLGVADLARSERFYVEALGFTRVRELAPPDGVTGKLLRIPEPVGARAVYLSCGPFVLELLHFDRDGNAPGHERVMTEPGLTHLSLTVDDLPATLELVTQHGGEVLDDTHVGVAVLVRDPDGQIVELIRSR
jgi:lactoylglutathione lyase